MDYPKTVLNVGLVNGKFIDEDNDTGQAGSLIPAVWGNAVTDELLAVIRAGGLEPAEDDHDQLQQALGSIVQQTLVQTLPSQDLTAFTTTGTAPGYVLSPVPALEAYRANQRYRVKFGAAGAGALTLNISGRGSKPLKQYDSNGSKVDTVVVAGQLADIEYDGAHFVLLTPLPNGVKASETSQGAAKIATQVQVDNGVDDGAIVTPKKLRFGFAANIAVNGYIAFPSWLGGVVLQWGTTTGSSVTFPLQFPSGVQHLELKINNFSSTGTPAAHYTVVTESSNTGFALQYAVSGFGAGAQVKWLAIGN